MVAVCAVFQLAGVKVKFAGDTVPSVVSLLESAIVTSAVGWLVSTTVKAALPPASVVTRSPPIDVTVMPAKSSLVLVTKTLAGSIPS